MSRSTSSAKSRKPVPVMPVRRDLTFDLPQDRVHDWACENVHFTHLMNTMSLVIPVGERFFIDAVRYYRDQIQDPELKKAATAFIGQEAMHGREHDEYNARVFERLPNAERFEQRVTALLRWFQKHTPPSFRLSGTIALEHLTAIMADGLLKEPRLKEKSEPGYSALWHWHALEETEHKAVSYDVWRTVMKPGLGSYLLLRPMRRRPPLSSRPPGEPIAGVPLDAASLNPRGPSSDVQAAASARERSQWSRTGDPQEPVGRSWNHPSRR